MGSVYLVSIAGPRTGHFHKLWPTHEARSGWLHLVWCWNLDGGPEARWRLTQLYRLSFCAVWLNSRFTHSVF